MAPKRRKFSAQFKAEAVQLVLESGRPVAHARELQVNEGTLEVEYIGTTLCPQGHGLFVCLESRRAAYMPRSQVAG